MKVYNRYFSGHCSQTASTRPLEIASLRGNCTQSSQLRVEEVKKKKKRLVHLLQSEGFSTEVKLHTVSELSAESMIS